MIRVKSIKIILTLLLLSTMFKRDDSKDISLHGGVPKQFYGLKNKVFNEWEIAPWELIIDKSKKLGNGNWANVYLAEWRKTTVVAKILKDNLDQKAKDIIIKELNNMTKMHHPNIVQLFGYVEEPFIIVMEYFENGDLYKNFHGKLRGISKRGSRAGSKAAGSAKRGAVSMMQSMGKTKNSGDKDSGGKEGSASKPSKGPDDGESEA